MKMMNVISIIKICVIRMMTGIVRVIVVVGLVIACSDRLICRVGFVVVVGRKSHLLGSDVSLSKLFLLRLELYLLG